MRNEGQTDCFYDIVRCIVCFVTGCTVLITTFYCSKANKVIKWQTNKTHVEFNCCKPCKMNYDIVQKRPFSRHQVAFVSLSLYFCDSVCVKSQCLQLRATVNCSRQSDKQNKCGKYFCSTSISDQLHPTAAAAATAAIKYL